MPKLVKATQFFLIETHGVGDQECSCVLDKFTTDREARQAAFQAAQADTVGDLRFYVTASTSGFRRPKARKQKVRKVVIGS